MPDTVETPKPTNGDHKSTPKFNPDEPGVRNVFAGLDSAIFPLLQQTMNAYSSRMEYFNNLMDPRRNLDKECGYPSTYSIGADFYRQLYDRDPIASRVVQLMPKECWQKTPRIFEDEDSKKATPFEDAWDKLGGQLSPERSWYEDEEGNLVWEYLRRADEVSGIGAFGIMLLGLDDGLDLREPVDGAISDKYVRDRGGDVKKGTNNSLRLDPRKLSFPTPLPSPDVLDEMVRNAVTPPIEDWAEHAGLPNKHVDQARAEAVKVRPTFVRNAQGEHTLELFNRDGRLVTNEYKAQAGEHEPTRNDFKTASQILGQDSQYFNQYGSSARGTDAQYVGVQLGPTQFPVEKPLKEGGLQLTFLRVFDEALVQIVQYEANIRNPRFSRPVMYRITFNDPREQHSGIGLPLASIYVHWTRIIHLADTGNGVSSEIFAAPRMRAVLNPLLDGRKIAGAGAEGYWQSCFAGIVLSTHPQLGGEVNLNKSDLKDMMESYVNGLQRYLMLTGMGASTLAPTVVDPTPHADMQIKRICIQLGCPKRVFEGSERGEQNSAQDDAKWNDRITSRCNCYITPRVICPFIDRLILLGVLPEPESYRIEWPDLDSTTKKDKATIAGTLTTALQAYVAGNVESVMTFEDYLVRVWDWDEEEAHEVAEATIKLHEKDMTMTMPPKGEPGHPATVPPPPPKTPPPGPMMMNPGQTMVPHPDNPKAVATQKPFTAPTPPPQPKPATPPTKNSGFASDEQREAFFGKLKEDGDNASPSSLFKSQSAEHVFFAVGKQLKAIVKNLPSNKLLNAHRELSQRHNDNVKSGHINKTPKWISALETEIYKRGLTKNVERIDMPQIRRKDWQDFLKFARVRTTITEEPACDPHSLHAIQSEFDQQRVDEMPMSKLDHPILVSRDGYVLDGNHRWIKAGQEGVTIPVLRLGMDKEFALDLLRSFPQAEYVQNTEMPQKLRERLAMNKEEWREFKETDVGKLTRFADRLTRNEKTKIFFEVDRDERSRILKKFQETPQEFVANEIGPDEVEAIRRVLALNEEDEYEGECMESLMQTALESTGGDVQAAEKFARQYCEMLELTEEGDEEDDEEGGDE